jgi:hypothetical protein
VRTTVNLRDDNYEKLRRIAFDARTSMSIVLDYFLARLDPAKVAISHDKIVAFQQRSSEAPASGVGSQQQQTEESNHGG